MAKKQQPAETPAPEATMAPGAEAAAPEAPEVVVAPAEISEAAPAPTEPPPPAAPQWLVSCGEKADLITAANADEAWAKFCDMHRSWPNPKRSGRKIEPVV